jgi:hypothetical protein
MLTKDQKDKGYLIELKEDYVLLWHNKNQIGLLVKTPDVVRRAQALVEKHWQEFENST